MYVCIYIYILYICAIAVGRAGARWGVRLKKAPRHLEKESEWKNIDRRKENVASSLVFHCLSLAEVRERSGKSV